MDNAQKAIMIGVGLFITVIVVAAIMTITGIGQDLLNSGQSQLSGLSLQLQQQITNEFDGVKMGGSKVLSAVNQYYNDNKLAVVVCNTTDYSSANQVWVTPNLISIGALTSSADRVVATTNATLQPNTGRIALSQFTNSSAIVKNRIVSTGQYMAKLIDNNGTVVGIAFLRLY